LRHVPLPLHVRSVEAIPAAQAAPTHTVPFAYMRHAPEPSQLPSKAQVDVALAAHWLSGSEPAVAVVQVPSEPARPHERQMPVQAVAQQNPCAHTFELHSPSPVHVMPLGFLPQLPAVQTFGDTQSVAWVPTVQLPRHAPPVAAHVNGAHDVGDGVTQVPVPLQAGAAVTAAPVQLCAPQLVPAA
jgi:hypothetical protein